jgi:hypothetical protein
MRCATLSPAPLWIISSLQTHLQTQIMFRSKRCAVSESVITRNSFMRRFTTARTSHPLLSICNTLTGQMPYNSTQRMHAPFPSLTPFASLRNRYDGGSVHSVQPPAQRQDRSYSITAEALARGADCCHPYWRNHGRPPLALPCFSCVYHRKQACWNVGADGRPFAAACKDVMILERYYTLPSGMLQLSAGVHTVNQQRKWISYSNTTTQKHLPSVK